MHWSKSMNDFNKFNSQLKYLLLSFLSCSLVAVAQDLSLECSGQAEMASNIGSEKSYEKESYDFKNGKLYGHIDAEWNENSIIIIFPKQKGVNTIEYYERRIIFDRLLGTVVDLTKMWSSDIRKIGNEPNAVRTFKGDCKKSTKKF